jgi:hypothetical protein
MLEVSEAGTRVTKAVRANRTSAITTNVLLVLGRGFLAGLVPVSTFALAAFATPAITDIAAPSLVPHHPTMGLPFSQRSAEWAHVPSNYNRPMNS